MRLDENFEGESSSKGTGFLLTSVMGVGIFLLLVFGIVLLVNKDTLFSGGGQAGGNASQDPGENAENSLISGSTLVSDDLDIWNDYPKEEESEPVSEVHSEESTEDDPSEGGTKTLVTFADGSEKWYSISKYLPQNEYDDGNFVLGNGRMAYYVDGNKASYTGVEVSKYQGYVDFNEVKKDGIDYVIIRLGSRGYSTGQLVLDDYFQDNIKRATDAGLDVGVSFYSQAITVDEAKEEADFVLQYIEDYDIQYPIVFVMEHVLNDQARIDELAKEDKTQISKAFMDAIDEAGYNAMFSGNKEWLFADVNYAAISNYEVCLKQEEDLPDYPYRFHIWQYTEKGTVDGISGQVPLQISFIDYTIK